MSNRKITLYATRGGIKKIETDVTTWGKLKPIVEAHYDLTNLQPTENVNKTTLIHNDAALPSGDFVLFLRPIKTKSGLEGTEGKGFRELREMVSNDAIKKHLSNLFTCKKNWTQLNVNELREGLASYEADADEIKRQELDREKEKLEQEYRELYLEF